MKVFIHVRERYEDRNRQVKVTDDPDDRPFGAAGRDYQIDHADGYGFTVKRFEVELDWDKGTDVDADTKADNTVLEEFVEQLEADSDDWAPND